MCSWGSNQQLDKFYKGAQNDTPWNKDLLWRYHVAKEHKQERVHGGELQPSLAAVKRRQQRMVMGISGTLIPAATPRLSALDASMAEDRDRLVLRSASGPRPPLERASTPWTPAEEDAAPPPSHARCRTSRALLSSSSLSSIGSLRLQALAASQAQDEASRELDGVRRALAEETRKREAADRTIRLLCERLGLSDSNEQ